MDLVISITFIVKLVGLVFISGLLAFVILSPVNDKPVGRVGFVIWLVLTVIAGMMIFGYIKPVIVW